MKAVSLSLSLSLSLCLPIIYCFRSGGKFYIHLTDGIEHVYRIYLTTEVDRNSWSYLFNQSEIMMNVESMCQFARFEVLIAVLLNVQVFWSVTPCLRVHITAWHNITSQMNGIFMCYFNNTSSSKILGLFCINKYVSEIKENYIENCSNVKLD
jgi:hypothetical protein